MRTGKIKISVVIPVFNRANTIEYCINSVLSQSYLPFEVIVVDDCSTDETVRLVQGYQKQRVRCLTLEKNSGAQAARNRGIVEAKGDWIAFLDSDDEWDSTKLELQIDALRKANFDPMTVVHADCWCYTAKTNKKSLWSLPYVDGDVYSQLLATNAPMFPAMLTSKIALEKIGLLDEGAPSYQEWDTAIRLAEHCRFIHLQEPLFTYHLHAGETISKDLRRDVAGYQYIVDKFKDQIISHCGVKTLNNHLCNNAIKSMRWGDYSKALEILNSSDDCSLEMSLLKSLARSEINPEFYLKSRGIAGRIRAFARKRFN